MSKLRWAQFFWADWQSDTALNLCSLSARGLWMALLCIAAQGEPYGHVNIKGRVPTADELFDLTAPRGTRRRDWNLWMAELERHGVAQRDHSLAIWSPRMSQSGVTSLARMDAANVRWKGQGNSHSDSDLHMQKPTDDADLHMQDTTFAYTESESESERKNPPVGPREAGTRASGSNPRANGSNPRATGDNPRANGTNPRSANPRPSSSRDARNACHNLLMESFIDVETDDANGGGASVVPFIGRTISG